MAQFLRSSIKQVRCILYWIQASRQRECELHIGALGEYYFAHDLYKYARLVPVYLAYMQLLKNTDKKPRKAALKCGDFTMTKSDIRFTNLFVDQTLEQFI